VIDHKNHQHHRVVIRFPISTGGHGGHFSLALASFEGGHEAEVHRRGPVYGSVNGRSLRT
jgi:hypothetical protein